MVRFRSKPSPFQQLQQQQLQPQPLQPPPLPLPLPLPLPAAQSVAQFLLYMLPAFINKTITAGALKGGNSY